MAKGQPASPEKSAPKVPTDVYEAELFRLQTELVKLQEWTRATGARIVIVFEGRDAAGKGGTIKRITEYLSPRSVRIAALPAPTERERGQWYFQRYIEHLPTRGEIVLFDRSWYNRAGVERVMGFCSPQEQARFLRQCPIFEQMLIDDGILLRKYWFSVSEEEQLRRFKARGSDPMRRWKHPEQPVVRGGIAHQEARPVKHDRAPVVEHPLRRSGTRDRRPAAESGDGELPPPVARIINVRRRLRGHPAR